MEGSVEGRKDGWGGVLAMRDRRESASIIHIEADG